MLCFVRIYIHSAVTSPSKSLYSVAMPDTALAIQWVRRISHVTDLTDACWPCAAYLSCYWSHWCLLALCGVSLMLLISLMPAGPVRRALGL